MQIQPLNMSENTVMFRQMQNYFVLNLKQLQHNRLHDQQLLSMLQKKPRIKMLQLQI